MNNFDNEEAGLLGLQVTHDTVTVLFQEASDIVPCKYKLS